MTVWTIDPSHSTAEFSVKHLMISTVTGRFKILSGTIEFHEDHPTVSKVNAEIDVASVDTGVEARDAHLRSPDFFDAKNHPIMTFESTRVEPRGPDIGRVHGTLSIRGVTREVALGVERDGTIKDPWGKERTGVTATTSLNRKDFGLNWNQVLEAGGVMVGDKINITLHIAAVKN